MEASAWCSYSAMLKLPHWVAKRGCLSVMEARLLSLSVVQCRQFRVNPALNPTPHLRLCQTNELQNIARCPDQDKFSMQTISHLIFLVSLQTLAEISTQLC